MKANYISLKIWERKEQKASNSHTKRYVNGYDQASMSKHNIGVVNIPWKTKRRRLTKSMEEMAMEVVKERKVGGIKKSEREY